MVLNMRFATRDNTLSRQVETGNDLVAGKGGGTHLLRSIRRGRVIESILSGKDIEAVYAKKMAGINQSFESHEDMHNYIGEPTPRLGTLEDSKASLQRRADPRIRDICAKALVVTNYLTQGDEKSN